MPDGVRPAQPGRSAGSAPAAILWDLDGTLLDSEKLWTVALYELAEHLGGQMTHEVRQSLIGSSGENTQRVIFAALGLDPHPEAMSMSDKWLKDRIGELFDAGAPIRPGALEALALVKESGLPTALITNTQRPQVERVIHSLQGEWFDVTVCGDEVPNGKPAPDIYLRGAELLGVAPEACLAIEDSPTGVLAAENAGCRVLVIPCDAVVPESPSRIFRETLVGLEMQHLIDAMR